MDQIPIMSLKFLVMSLIAAKHQQIHDRTASQIIKTDHFDFIIVGAGTAGCTVAHRLSANSSIQVLLLEAGGAQSAIYHDIPALTDEVHENTKGLSWDFINQPMKKSKINRQTGEFTGKVIGGCSTHNGMMFNRGNKKCYDNWFDNYGAYNWSFSRILPYFKMFENNTDQTIVKNNPNYHGTDGPVQISTIKDPPKFFELFEESFKEYGFKQTDFNGPDQVGYASYQQTITSDGLRASNANAYVDPNRHPGNLYISANSLVTKIIFDNITAIGVEYLKDNKTHRIFARKEVIITAGAIKTPQLLMLSGIGIKGYLKKWDIPVIIDLPVGQHYKNHVKTFISVNLNDPKYFYPKPKLNEDTLSELYNNKSGSLTKYPTFGLYFNTYNNKHNDWPNALLTISVRESSLILTVNLERIRSEGKIELNSIDSLVEPVIYPNFLDDDDDFNDLVDAVKFTLKVMSNSSLTKYIHKFSFKSCPHCDKKDIYKCTESIDCLVRSHSGSSFHPCCTCRMGDKKRDDVVVDPFLRVKHARNLRICDASIFPDIPNANTNAPTNMVAEKCASMIKAKHKF